MDCLGIGVYAGNAGLVNCVLMWLVMVVAASANSCPVLRWDVSSDLLHRLVQ